MQSFVAGFFHLAYAFNGYLCFNMYPWGFSGGSDGKESACNAWDPGSIPGSGRSPGERKEWQLTPLFSSGKYHRQRRLVGYSPWGGKRDGYNWVTNTHKHTCTYITILFLFNDEILFHCMNVPQLLIHSTKWVDIWAVSMFWLLWVTLLSTFIYKFCLNMFSFLLTKYLGMELQSHMTPLCLTFWGTT